MSDADSTFDEAFGKIVDLGNNMADMDRDAETWDIADGLLAGAIQYWLYSRRPCGDPLCEDCAPLNTAQARLAELLRLAKAYAEDSEYFHAPTDANVGRA